MELTLSAEHANFRDEVRAFLDAKLTPDMRAEAARSAGVFSDGPLVRRWHKVLFEQGWIAPSWPVEYGGCGWSIVQRYIWDSELAAANAPTIPAMGLQMCGPVLMRFGTPAQKAHYLPRILSGEHYWCQGYSEPGAGSDLAALQTKAVRDGDSYVINGSKIWTTHAHFANRIFVLARTRAEGKPQAGISFFLVDMATKGLSVAPIVSISGDHEVNQVFFEDVRIPADALVGAENDGWTVAKYLLEFERGGAFASRLEGALAQVRRIAREEMSDGRALIADPDFARRWAQLALEISGVAALERRIISTLSTGGNPGPSASSMLKLKGTETMQKVTELALEAVAHYAAPDTTEARRGLTNSAPNPTYAIPTAARYLNARASTIYGGSSEVQRNILAKMALGL
ncbi:MAG: acyl-CoA dehydrogenase family protein [Alphaproteobacteria bacterium]|nr:acyl-CoA dehydrogenase family protein [Alphaproteobacteria bacterium]